MVNAPGRNEQCPCMSGQKYKKCCGQTGLWLNFKSQNISYFNERYYFGNLLQNDPIFLKFYVAERNKIYKQLLCFKSDYAMSSSASYGNVGDIAYMILSNHEQVAIEDSIHMAHEISHLVLHSEGHKVVNLIDDELHGSVRIHKFLNDMIYDPLLNKKLIVYGYDLEGYLKLADKKQLGMPNVGDNEMLVTTLYVKRVLDFRNLQPDIDENDIDFVKWVQKDFPQVIEKSKDILNILTKYSLEVPKQSEAALNEIIKYLNLDSLLKIGNL